MNKNRHTQNHRSMRTAICVIAALAGLTSKQSFAEPTTTRTGELTIEVVGLKKTTGTIRIAIFASKETWLKKPVYTAVVPAANKSLIYTKHNTPYGEYGVAIYHDVNNNDKMDRNFLGLPKEPYAFSNNARGSFGPPKWKKSKISITQPTSQFEIRIK